MPNKDERRKVERRVGGGRDSSKGWNSRCRGGTVGRKDCVSHWLDNGSEYKHEMLSWQLTYPAMIKDSKSQDSKGFLDKNSIDSLEMRWRKRVTCNRRAIGCVGMCVRDQKR
jgi:hypothetical protein